MQCVSWADGKAVVDELPVFTEYGSFYDLIAAVCVVVEQRVSDVLHMDADLVRAACFEYALDEGDVSESFEHFIMGDGFFAVFAFGVGIKQLAKTLVSTNVSYYGTLVFGQVSPDEGHVLSFDGMVKELFGQAANGFFRFGEDHQSAGILVDAVYKTEAGEGLFVDVFVLLLQVPGDPIDQCTAVIAAGGVYDESGWFVDDHHVIVFIVYIERHFFGDDLFARSFLIGVGDDLVEGTDLVVGGDGFVVDEDHTGFEGFLDLVPGGVLDALDEEFVDAHRFLAFIDFDIQSFVQLVGAVGGWGLIVWRVVAGWPGFVPGWGSVDVFIHVLVVADAHRAKILFFFHVLLARAVGFWGGCDVVWLSRSSPNPGQGAWLPIFRRVPPICALKCPVFFQI